MEFITVLDIIGTIAFALSGYILASKHKLDILGISILSYITAFGGGVVRDLLVDRTPFIFSETYPITVVFLTIIVAYTLKLHKQTRLTNNRVFQISDSIGLTVFAYTGASVGIHYGFNFGGVVFLSLLTSIGGGVISSMIVGKIPHILVNEFYGTISLIVGVLVWFSNYFGINGLLTTFTILIIGFVLRILAINFNWKLPKAV